MPELQHSNGEHPHSDSGQLVLFFIFLAVWVVDSFFLRFSTFPADGVPLLTRLVLAAALLVAAILLVRAGHTVIGHDDEQRGLVTTGAFRYVRHPLYLGSMLFYLGLLLATFSLASLGVFVVIVIFYNHIAGYEERLLEERFGEEYARYRERSGRWLPGVG